jgi:ring-1,2-phenylacetyl-CoA epoxidase subunit PaaE
MPQSFHPLTVADIRSEIDGSATSITFSVPPHLASEFTWRPGQHLSLRLQVNGEERRRSYTISNPPGAPLRITVKRVKKGCVSNFVGDTLKVGDQLEVMAPKGRFVLDPQALGHRTHYFFAAGSGITPIFSMVNAVLADEPYAVAHLVYGNVEAGDILFEAELTELLERYGDRLTVRHVLSAPSMWSWFTPWRKGRVDAEAIQAAITETPPVAQDVHYWICGPGSMNQDVRQALNGLDVPNSRIHSESFGGEGAQDTSVSGVASQVTVKLLGQTQTVSVAAGQTLLEAMRASGLRPPFSCQSGVCGACIARTSQGKVHMRSRVALEDGDISKGYVLTCQSVPTAEKMTLTFEA